MILISQSRHPDHRAMTLVAVIATFLDTVKSGQPQTFPPVFDDVKKKKEIPPAEIRQRIKILSMWRCYATRMVEGKLVVYKLEKPT